VNFCSAAILKGITREHEDESRYQEIDRQTQSSVGETCLPHEESIPVEKIPLF
jgi:hypothetical protein